MWTVEIRTDGKTSNFFFLISLFWCQGTLKRIFQQKNVWKFLHEYTIVYFSLYTIVKIKTDSTGSKNRGQLCNAAHWQFFGWK